MTIQSVICILAVEDMPYIYLFFSLSKLCMYAAGSRMIRLAIIIFVTSVFPRATVKERIYMMVVHNICTFIFYSLYFF